MSLFSKVLGGARSALSSLSKVPGVGAVMKVIPGLGTAATAMSIYQGVKGIGAAAVKTVAEHPIIASGAVLGGAAAAGGIVAATRGGGGLTPLPGGALAGGAMIPGGHGMRTIISSANSYARKYPQWAMSVGGTAGIAQMIASGQLPAMRRRRGKGITARDLRSFKRVARLVSHFSRPVHHMRGYGKHAKH